MDLEINESTYCFDIFHHPNIDENDIIYLGDECRSIFQDGNFIHLIIQNFLEKKIHEFKLDISFLGDNVSVSFIIEDNYNINFIILYLNGYRYVWYFKKDENNICEIYRNIIILEDGFVKLNTSHRNYGTTIESLEFYSTDKKLLKEINQGFNNISNIFSAHDHICMIGIDLFNAINIKTYEIKIIDLKKYRNFRIECLTKLGNLIFYDDSNNQLKIWTTDENENIVETYTFYKEKYDLEIGCFCIMEYGLYLYAGKKGYLIKFPILTK